MRLFITGGSGFIGRALISRLAADASHEITLLLRPERENQKTLPPPLAAFGDALHLVYADLRQAGATRRAIRAARPDAVIHLAAAGATQPFLPVETAVAHNLHGTLNLLHACFRENEAPPSQVIVARTPGERAAMNVYAASKGAAWQFCRFFARARRQPIHGAMIFQAYGPGQAAKALVPAALRAALAGEDFPMTGGEQQRDWIYVGDVAAGLAAMLAQGEALPPGTTAELGGGRPVSVAAVVNEIYDLVGGPGRPAPGALPDRPGEVDHQVARAARTRTQIGWETAVSLREGLQRTRRALQQPTPPPQY
jgi:nucleoside-diphosphate-sugar epimerase